MALEGVWKLYVCVRVCAHCEGRIKFSFKDNKSQLELLAFMWAGEVGKKSLV